MSKYTLTCCGGIGNATGANFLFEGDGVSFLVDCGLVQGSQFAQAENHEPLPYDASKVECLLITHAHMDHIGRIPKLVKEGFKGTIYSTSATKELASVMLDDAYGLITRDAQMHNLPPLYEKEDIARAISLWKTVEYHQSWKLYPEIEINLRDAGHVLGSSIIEVTINGTKVIFTGDLGNSPTPLLRDTEVIEGAKYMVIESVYGDRNHEPKADRDEKLKQILNNAVNHGGTVVIPAFSLERTQVILYEINELIENNKLPRVPVYMDSPLASKVTAIYRSHVDVFNDKIKKQIAGGDDIFDFPGLIFVKNSEESRTIHGKGGAKIIIAGSGMSVGGRVLSHEAFYLSDPNATILVVGYQVAGSLGRRIEEGQKDLVIEGQKVKVHAHIEKIGGYSSHKDSDHLVEFTSHSAESLVQVFVAMGEPKSSLFLAQRLHDELGLNAIFPEKGKKYDLEF
jgi:metallo-beta-lactamase family protein